MNAMRKLIVAVEDEEAVLSVTTRLLDKAGYDVLPFSHPHRARDFFENAIRSPALMLTDIMMPGMSGFELAAIAREEHPALPIIFTSGYPEENLPAELCELPEMSCMITKPYDLNTLRFAIEDLLAGRPLSFRNPALRNGSSLDFPVTKQRRIV
jgi:two-component system cell cycle sensor histidine kinase/response regulator CckA